MAQAWRYTDILFGIALSFAFGALTFYQVKSGGVGTEITLTEFFQVPGNVLFCLLMALFAGASWVMQGINNRVVIVLWALAFVINNAIYFGLYQVYYHNSVNIYILNLAEFVSAVPVVLLFRYRVSFTWRLARLLFLCGVSGSGMAAYLRSARGTDFETRMRQVLYFAFVVDLMHSAYLTVYSMFYQISATGSVIQHMLDHGNFDLFDVHYFIKHIITIMYICIICFYLYRDNIKKDALFYGVSEQTRKKVAAKLVEEAREKARKKK